MGKYSFYSNINDSTGALSCLLMLFKFYHIEHKLDLQTCDAETIMKEAEVKGLRCTRFTLPVENITLKQIITPFIVELNDDRFIIVYKIKWNKVTFADPAKGIVKLKLSSFRELLNKPCNNTFYVFQPTPKVYNKTLKVDKRISSLSYYASYTKPYKKYFVQLGFGLIIGSVLQLIPPFLTKVLIDKAVGLKDLTLVNIIIIGMLTIAIAKVVSQFIRDWINFYIGQRINISAVSDFLHRVLCHPIAFFDGRNIGDILQRIGDHKRIENFIINSLLNILFSLLNLIIFGSILAYFSLKIFAVFAIGSILYFLWTLLFFSIRKEIDVAMFQQNASIQSMQIQLLQGIQEIKLFGYEQLKRGEWEKTQVGLYKSSARMLKIEQAQIIGSTIINESKNIVILFLSAQLVISGDISLGVMLAIQYIMGQVNQPINQAIKFMQDAQFASISMNRLAQISSSDNEYEREQEIINTYTDNRSIVFNSVFFKYNNKDGSNTILRKINITIQEGKITGIIGASGCGKTTLLKLIAKFYAPMGGTIKLGDANFINLNTKWWRSKIGVIFQDSILFNDTVINNIIDIGKPTDMHRLLNAVKLANIQDDIEKFPMGYNTIVGGEGHKVSQGQKQRILIAGLIYKDPDYVLLDEATSALDANNEKEVLENLFNFFKNKTVILVTHRLSTIKSVDMLAVMDKGEIVEFGTSEELYNRKGYLYKMVEKL